MLCFKKTEGKPKSMQGKPKSMQNQKLVPAVRKGSAGIAAVVQKELHHTHVVFTASLH